MQRVTNTKVAVYISVSVYVQKVVLMVTGWIQSVTQFVDFFDEVEGLYH